MIRLLLVFLAIALMATTLSAQGAIEDKIAKSNLVYSENPAESFSLCESAEREAKQTGDHQFDGNISFCKARYYILIAKYDAASSELNKATLFFEERNDKVNLASVYSLKNILLNRIGDEDEAHRLMLKVVDLDRETNNIDHLIGALNNLSLDYKRTNQPDSMRYVLEQIEDLEAHFEPTDYLYFYQNWGLYHMLTADYGHAIQLFNSAIQVAEQQKMTDSKATNLASLSKAYRLNGDFSLAEKYAEESYNFSQENNLIYETSEALVEWIAVKEVRGDYKGAYEIQKKWVRVDKKINDLERIQKVKAIEGQLELAEKEKKIIEGEVALKESKLRGEEARTRNAWLVGIILLIVVLLIYTAFIYVRTRKLNKTINEQKEEVEIKSLKLEEALGNIQDSLEYSKMIQSSMLPDRGEFEKIFREHFVFYRPKDIVSGDFYWIQNFDNHTILAVGDCTGHGVPGAMVSMVCHEALNKVIIEQEIRDPGQILDGVRTIVSSTFKRNTYNLSDGMDIALVKVEGKTLSFAGANNPVWIIQPKSSSPLQDSTELRIIDYDHCQIVEIKPNKQPVGHYLHPKPFTTKHFELNLESKIYLFSDGYADQFGGDKGKKLKISNMKEIIAKSSSLSMHEQGVHLGSIFSEWKGELEQIDDVCVVGVKM